MTEKGQDKGIDTRLKKSIKIFLYLMAILFSLFHLYIAGVGLVSIERSGHIHLMMSMVLIFLIYPLTQHSWRRPGFYLDFLFACLGVTVGLYLEIEHMNILSRIGELNTLDVIMGTIAVFLTLEICRRTVGWPIVLTVMAFMAYDYFGEYIPGHFGHKGHTWSIMINTLYPQVRGIYGLTLGVVVKFVVLFIVFGAFLQKTGAGDFFVRAAFIITGRARGGPAKAAVIASALMGSISGSPTANIVTTGTFTIPMMKKIGYPPHVSGGVEVAASSGGTIMPPIMGAAAFLIVALTGIPYVDIMLASIIPSLLYFISVFASVHFTACRLDLRGEPVQGNYWLNFFRTIWNSVHYLIPLFLLVTMLLMGYSATYAAFGSIVCLIVVSSFKKQSRMSVRDFFDALALGARNSLSVSAACACVGIIVGIVGTTGVGIKFSSLMVSIAGGNIFIAIVLIGLASLVLGIELPISASYLVLAVMAAPALEIMGIPLLIAHLVILWFSIDAAITPPVCICSYVAAGIAEANPFKTALQGWKMSKGLYIIPFLLVYTPIALNGHLVEVVFYSITGGVGLVCLAAAWEGWLIIRAKPLERVLLAATTVCTLNGEFVSDLIGIALAAGVVTLQVLRMKDSKQTRRLIEETAGERRG